MKDSGIKKLYYSISEVSKLTQIEQYTLRYWENEFPQLKPSKNRAGNRIYTNQDISLILQIKELLKYKKYTFEGARSILVENNMEKASESQIYFSPIENHKKEKQILEKTDNYKKLSPIQKDLYEIKEILLLLKAKI